MPNENRKNSKWLVYFCIILLVVAISVVVFVSVIMPKHPTLNINKLDIKSLEYDYSKPLFNITLHMTILLKNKNFGHLEFYHMDKNETMISLSYGNGSVVSSSKLKTRRVASRGEEEVEVKMMLSSSKNRTTVMDGNDKLKSDLKLGFLELKGYATLKGRIHLLKKFTFPTVASMNCDIVIDLKRKLVQRLAC